MARTLNGEVLIDDEGNLNESLWFHNLIDLYNYYYGERKIGMTREEIIADKRYHTCGRCRWNDLNDDFYPCNKCIHGVDKREDFWQYAECEEEDGHND